MKLNHWTQNLHDLYDSAVGKYAAGERGADTFFNPREVAFLASIGILPINLYDYAEDFPKTEELDWDTVLLMMSARRDYFLVETEAKWSETLIEETDLPPKTEALDGIVWLPRIILKAESYLKGALPPETMYCCGGDRKFLTEHNLHPADFLRVVWAARGDKSKIVDFVRRGRQRE